MWLPPRWSVLTSDEMDKERAENGPCWIGGTKVLKIRCSHYSSWLPLSMAGIFVLNVGPPWAQQPGAIQYFYDDLGRLVKVIDADGNVAEYVYDAVGNILEIKRSTITELALLNFTPSRGPVGTQVTLQGQGFSATPSANTVTF